MGIETQEINIVTRKLIQLEDGGTGIGLITTTEDIHFIIMKLKSYMKGLKFNNDRFYIDSFVDYLHDDGVNADIAFIDEFIDIDKD